jgi:2'-5' RNA ligase
MRTFVAVFPPPPVLEALGELRRSLEPAMRTLKWTAERNLHFTLRFFGDLTADEAARAGEVLSAVAAQAAPFDLDLHGAGVFPDWRRPRVLWAGCSRGGATLQALARTLERGFRDARLGKADKPFKSHLTLGRWRDSREMDAAAARTACDGVGSIASFTVQEVGVIRSTLSPGGSIYEPLHVATLRRPGDAGAD